MVERVLLKTCTLFFETVQAFGPNQFAYSRGKGSRDALALLTLSWLQAVAAGRNVEVYCSDVAGAFDRVSKKRLVRKLRAKKIHMKLVRFFTSWLRKRTAKFVVDGAQSVVVELTNMVYQGTVWGLTLRNMFFDDARQAVQEFFFRGSSLR